ncbi:hypothetical protein [Spiroplasma endosymbiont of Polydrusus cervinus]|uniref:hypothetical protein n=1 Tax=Spiroplasma endosymbiont of Polydrusus cervinus TaxID=3066287 RepID=UPI0030D5D6D4
MPLRRVYCNDNICINTGNDWELVDTSDLMVGTTSYNIVQYTYFRKNKKRIKIVACFLIFSI